MAEDILRVKMRNNRLEIVVDEYADYDRIKEQLFRKLDNMSHFIKGGQSKILIAGKEFSEGQKREIAGIIKTDYNVLDVGFCTLEHLEQLHARQYMSDLEGGIKGSYVPSVFKMGRVDSGTVIKSEGDMTIIGDVEKGAELIAKGSICVLGVMRGSAAAGTGGNDEAVIVASILEANRLSIGRYTGVAPKDNISIGEPEYAHILDGKIVIEPVRNETAFDGDDERQRGILNSIKRFFTTDK